ncbi:MAG: FUSC family protein [Erysipelotrichaceae bacterium]
MPKIGLRIIKSSIAVLLCFIVYIIRGEGVPFYAAIAAILCIQPEISKSKFKAKSRIIATIIGGIIGMLILAFKQNYMNDINIIYYYLLVAIMIIPLLYIPTIIKQSDSSYLTCVVFLSITVSHIGDINPFIFGTNRIIDTLIGVFIAITINTFKIPKKINDNLKFIIPLEAILNNNNILTKQRIKLNKYLDDGATLILTTSHLTCNAIIPLNPIINNKNLYISILNNNAIYNYYEDIYKYISNINIKDKETILEYINNKYNTFIYEIKDNMMYAHYIKLNNYMEINYNKQRKLNKIHFIRENNINIKEVLAIELNEEETIINNIIEDLKTKDMEIRYIRYSNRLLIINDKAIFDHKEYITINEKEDKLLKEIESYLYKRR